MGRRKGWHELVGKDGKPSAYRRRLERAGITRRMYEAGASLSAARGHAHTPERPHEARRNPQRFAAYLERHPNAGKPMTAFVWQTDYDPKNPYHQAELAAHVDWTKADRTTIAKHWNAVKDWLHTKANTENERNERFRALFAPFEDEAIGGYKNVPEYKLETRRSVIDAFLLEHEDEPYEHIYEEPD